MTNRSRAATLLAVVACLGGSLPIQAQRYNFKFYGQDEGLQNLAVQTVLQDRAGYLWVGTKNGLYRYDGSRFKAFNQGDGLPGASVESLHESVDGTFWVGTAAGLARRKGGRFETVPLGLAHAVLGREAIASDPQGRLYVATDRGLLAGSSKGGSMQFTLVGSPGTSVETASVYLDQTGRLWYGCGLDLCILENGTSRRAGRELGLPEERWDAILQNPDGALWVRSEESLYIRPHGSKRFQRESGIARSEHTFPTLGLDAVGRLLVPTDAGLLRRKPQGWDVIAIDDGLGSSDISAATRDREGNIWLGLPHSGLVRWLGYNEWQSWTGREGLSHSSVRSMARDATGTLWAGTEAGLEYAQERDGRLSWRRQKAAYSGGEINAIRSMVEGPDRALWIADGDDGLVRMDPGSRQLQHFGNNAGLKGDIEHLMLDHEGRLWASTSVGLYRTTASTRASAAAQFEPALVPGSNSSKRILMAVEDRAGGIWAASDLGLARLTEDGWVRYTAADGLKSNRVARVTADADGSIWIGYQEALGITHLSVGPESVNMQHYTAASGLRSDQSMFLGFDRRGWLWVGSDHGVDVFDHEQWRHFGRSDGLIWDDCNANAFLATGDGAVWIGTSRGLSRFAPQPVPPPSIPPQVVFTSVTVAGTPVEDTGELGVPWNQPLQVRFTALTFANESRVAFRYRLGGPGSSWQDTTQRELNFPALPARQWTLEVLAQNAQGVWSTAPAVLTFQVLPPWWGSPWLIGGLVFFLGVFAHVILRHRIRHMQAERSKLEEAVEVRTHELVEQKARVEQEKAVVDQQKFEIERLLDQAKEVSRLKSEFLANMSHEIRTPMNGVLGMTDMVLATQLSTEQREYLETARLSASFLLAILNDILDFSKIEAGRLDLNPIEFSLQDCLEQTERILALQIANKKLDYRVSVDPGVPARLSGDPDRLRQVLINLVGNAIKFTDRGGVSVSVTPEPVETGVGLRFAVRDSGVGIPADKQSMIFDAFRQADGSTTRKYGGTGLGLAICSRLVELMGGRIWVESETGRGSTFYFIVRLGAVTKSSANIESGLHNLTAAVGTLTAEPVIHLRILLVEDNHVNQRLATKLLEKRGHHVTVTGTGQGAVQQAQNESFDVILMDVQMPDMDGLEATTLIRAAENGQPRRTPIIAVTAHSMKGDRERCLAAGMDNYITKPFDAVRLIEVVESAAGRDGAAAPVANEI